MGDGPWTNTEVALIIVAAIAAVFALAVGVLYLLERVPALRRGAGDGSASRAAAIVELVGACALLAAAIGTFNWGFVPTAAMVIGASALSVDAACAFVHDAVLRRRLMIGRSMLFLVCTILVALLGRR